MFRCWLMHCGFRKYVISWTFKDLTHADQGDAITSLSLQWQSSSGKFLLVFETFLKIYGIFNRKSGSKNQSLFMLIEMSNNLKSHFSFNKIFSPRSRTRHWNMYSSHNGSAAFEPPNKSIYPTKNYNSYKQTYSNRERRFKVP